MTEEQRKQRMALEMKKNAMNLIIRFIEQKQAQAQRQQQQQQVKQR